MPKASLVVFATETLALGINMPARTVVIEKLVKFDGESHKDITPGAHELTGRAGRRGIDVEGHAMVMWQPGLDPGSVAGLRQTDLPLNSSFKPTYNMSVNLLARFGRERSQYSESSLPSSKPTALSLTRPEVQRQERSCRIRRIYGVPPEILPSMPGPSRIIKAEKTASRSRQRVQRRTIMESLNNLAVGISLMSGAVDIWGPVSLYLLRATR